MEKVREEIQRSLADRVIVYMAVLVSVGFFTVLGHRLLHQQIWVQDKVLLGSAVCMLVYWAIYFLHRTHSWYTASTLHIVSFFCLLLFSFGAFYNPLQIKEIWFGFLLYPIIISLFHQRRHYLFWSSVSFLAYVVYFLLTPYPYWMDGGSFFYYGSKAICALTSFALGLIIVEHLQRVKAGYMKVADKRTKDYVCHVLYSLIPIVERKTQTSSREIEEALRLMKRVTQSFPRERVEDWELRLLAVLHYVSRIKWPDYVFEKAGRLTTFEYQIVQEHCFFAKDIMYGCPECERISVALEYHHERLDGTGYPHQIRGEEIPYLAQVLGIVDSYMAMTMSRPYRVARSREEAFRDIQSLAGSAYHPELVEALAMAIGLGNHSESVRLELPEGLYHPENQYVG